MTDLIKDRESALNLLRVFRQEPSEENIAFVMGLQAQGIDAFQALFDIFFKDEIEKEEYAKLWPSYPGEDLEDIEAEKEREERDHR